ncbi:MAG: hypothetical protein ABIY55_09680 [Kofleriaceae bacterium]
MTDSIGRAWKLVILVAAGLATYSFFQPFYTVRVGDAVIPVSAYRIVVGFTEVAQLDPDLRAPADPARLLADFNDAIRQETSDNPNVAPQASRIPAYYLSALTLLVVGGVACARRRLGLIGSLFTLGAGLCATWGCTRHALIARHATHAGEVYTLSAAPLWLGAAGLLALLAGVGAFVWADPGGFRARRTISALVVRGEGPVALEMPSGARDAAIPTATLKAPRGKPGAD